MLNENVRQHMNEMARDSQKEEEGVKKRFWAKVEKVKSGCWKWRAAKTREGYGFLGKAYQGRTILAHKIAWYLETGDLIEGNEWVMKNGCGNKGCVNPKHWELVDRWEVTGKITETRSKAEEIIEEHGIELKAMLEGWMKKYQIEIEIVVPVIKAIVDDLKAGN